MKWVNIEDFLMTRFCFPAVLVKTDHETLLREEIDEVDM